MKASSIIKVIDKLIDSQLPVFIWGAPGIGKSSIVTQIAQTKGLDFLDLRLSLLDPTDLKGIPFFNTETKEGTWAKPSFLPNDPCSKGILFLDEINTAPPAVQASAYQLILDRKVGEYELPKGWSIVAAGNRENDRGVIYKMPPPLANRFVHFEMEVDFDDWKAWAYNSGIESTIIGYLAYDKSMLFTFDPTSNEKAFATPRSWEYVDSIVKSSIDADLMLDSISGAVGREAAVGYSSFKKVMKQLPDLSSILDGTLTEFKEENLKVLMALTVGLVNAVRESVSSEAIENVLNFSLQLPSEFAIMLVKDLQSNGLDIEGSPAWGDWVKKFAYLLG
ncbi:MAG: MoxR family ATPase [Sulfurovum sp.]|nr:MoxR family ATPase [Sulfurovum sp.]MCB4744067.1 MoxR family ATPase [Sulfurovum sp.]MCB4750569.1 MoxR family ATPase [Sulfurovum sp.]MCB4752064.1 MoxR family ATPase [Sulfurovum sp.]MCB4752915.1 MoxR family ATPase [Sulfurovum sp.]